MKNDFVFKRIFAYKGNEEYLKDFLSSLLKMDIKEIELEHDVSLEKDLIDEKIGVLDVKATLNNNVEVDIEIQLKNYDNMIERAEFYASKMLSAQLKKGEEYIKVKPVIIISILDFDYFEFEEHITKGIIVAEKHREKIIDKYVTYYYIELPKFRRKKLDKEDKTSQWLTFIDSENEKRVMEVMEKNDKVKKANEELEYLSGDERVRRLAELRESGLREMAAAKRYGYNKGKEEEKIEIAKAMLKEGLDIKTIIKVTGLSKDEVENLK